MCKICLLPSNKKMLSASMTFIAVIVAMMYSIVLFKMFSCNANLMHEPVIRLFKAFPFAGD